MIITRTNLNELKNYANVADPAEGPHTIFFFKLHYNIPYSSDFFKFKICTIIHINNL